MTPSNAEPVPVTCTGLTIGESGAGLVIDNPGSLTMIDSQMPPLVLPSRRESVTVILPPTNSVLLTFTTALTSCVPPPLIRVDVELGDQLSKLTARAVATWVGLSFQD